MPELPIYPDRVREAPGYALERRLARFRAAPASRREEACYWLSIECVFETLRLTGAEIDRALIARLARERPAEAERRAREASREPDETALVVGQLDALEHIETAAREAATPSLAAVRAVHQRANPLSEAEFRAEDSKPQFRNARASSARFIEARLADLLEWLSAESGRSMFPAERMALWFPRFLEIAPFDRGNFRTAHLFLSFFARAAGFPPVTLRFEEAEEIRADVERALLFDTFPLVRRFSDALGRSLDVAESVSSES